MGRSENGQHAPRLLRLARQFAAWRAERSFGARIPDRLWAAAAKAAASCGVHQTAKALRLDYYAVQRRVQSNGSQRVTTRAGDSLPTFVELPASTLATAAGECILEFEKPEGSKLRVHLKGVHVPDLLALGAGFWNAE